MNFIAFDTEDDSAECLAEGRSGFEKKVTQIAAMDTRGNQFYSDTGDVEKFRKWLSQYESIQVYAHNLQYDLGNIFGSDLDSLNICMVGGRIIKATWKGCTFLDSFNIWPMSLKKVGEAFGMKKLDMDVRSREYVFQDVKILITAMTYARDLVQEFGVDKFSNTLGGLCVKLWKAMDGKNWTDSSALCKEAYYGGRVELFSKGGSGNIVYTDINSLYPFVMTKEFPCAAQERKGIEGYGVARVKIRVPEMVITPLPMRRDDGSIYYPWGVLEGVWTYHEIRNAVDNGAKILKIFDSYGCKKADYYYRDFVKTFYEKRLKEETDCGKTFFKLLMNNLYGQLGMSGIVTRSLAATADNIHEGVLYGKNILADIQMPLPEHVNYLHAAYITSYARLELQKYLRLVPEKDLIYCDTDSVIFYNKGKKLPFPIGKDLGMMKLEGTANWVKTFAPKMYQFGEDFKAKGVPKRLAEKFIKTGSASFEIPFKMREAINFYDRGNIRKLSVWRRVEKFKRSDYDKKRVKDNRYYPLRSHAVAS